MLPCEPNKNVKTFNSPTVNTYVYTFNCEFEAMKFMLISKDHNPNSEKDKQKFLKIAEEELLISIAAKGKVIKTEEVQVDNSLAHLLEIEFGQKVKVKTLIVITEKSSLTALFGPPQNTVATNDDRNYDEIGKKFINSVHILMK